MYITNEKTSFAVRRLAEKLDLQESWDSIPYSIRFSNTNGNFLLSERVARILFTAKDFDPNEISGWHKDITPKIEITNMTLNDGSFQRIITCYIAGKKKGVHWFCVYVREGMLFRMEMSPNKIKDDPRVELIRTFLVDLLSE